MILIARDTDHQYYLVEEAHEVDKFKFGEFSFFHLYGIVDYTETFKIWLRKFPRPTVIFATKGDLVVSFIYIDPWEELPEIVNVLRAQETVEKYRKKRIGYKMFLLGAVLTPDYIITKPLTEQSRNFYIRLGFEKIENISIFRNYHQITGYLALPINKKRKHIDEIEHFFSELYI